MCCWVLGLGLGSDGQHTEVLCWVWVSGVREIGEWWEHCVSQHSPGALTGQTQWPHWDWCVPKRRGSRAHAWLLSRGKRT